MSGPLSPLPISIPAASLTSEALTDASLGQRDTIVPTTSTDFSVTLGTKVAKRLLVYDANLVANAGHTEKLMARFRDYNFATGQIESFRGWAELVAKLQEYTSIEELMLYIHGAPGQFEIVEPDGTSRPRDITQMVPLFAGVAPKVTKEVILESCVVAHNPAQTVALKGLFDAPKISGWTHFQHSGCHSG